jgi:hypothetical protein
VPALRVDYAAHGPKDLLGVRDGGTAMTAALRVTAAAKAATGEVLPAHIHPDGQSSHHRQTERASRAGISVRTQRKLDRLAKVRPDLLAEVRTGRPWSALGFADLEDLLRRGVEIDPELVGWAMRGLHDLEGRP